MTGLYVEHPEIEVLQVPSEFESLLAIYRERSPRRVLEIGSWQGGTLHAWLTEVEPEMVVAVDLDHQRADLYDNWKRATTLDVITGDSHDIAVQTSVRHLGPYDWMFVDGDHGEASVRSDVQLCLSCAAPGATLVLHDVALGAGGIGDPGPRIVLEELRSKYVVREFVEEPYAGPWAHGLAVIDLP